MRKRARLWNLGARLFMRLWYGFTQLVTRRYGVTLPKFSTPAEIGAHMRTGDNRVRYRLDPLKGKLDVLNHPTKVQARIQGTGNIEDCDGHAGFWCAGLIGSNLSTYTYFATLYMRKADGTRSGHALCVFRVGTHRYWADYYDPEEYVDDWEWAHQCAATFDAVPLAATLTHVPGISKGGRVKFGYMKTHVFEES